MSTIPVAARPKACLGCVEAKRRCSKHTPICRRCAVKGLNCKYPLARPSAVYESLVRAEATEQIVGPVTTGVQLAVATDPCERWDHLDENPNPGASSNSRLPWFVSTEYWDIAYPRAPHQEETDMENSALSFFVQQVQSWLGLWVTRGHSPLIHRQLYHRELPECIQDAYTATATYVHKNPETHALALRIVGERATKLARQHQVVDASLEPSLAVAMLDTASHVARTQALVVYQLIGLFDGDIQARSQAEAHMELLDRWARQMWQSAHFDVTSVQLVSSAGLDDDLAIESQLNAFDTNRTPSSLWHAWILAESVHRTYLLALYMQAIYLTLKVGWSACPGTAPLSVVKGLWDSPSAYSWSQVCKRTEDRLLACFLTDDRLFAEARPGDMDEFSAVFMVPTHGLERLEQWAGEKGGHFSPPLPMASPGPG